MRVAALQRVGTALAVAALAVAGVAPQALAEDTTAEAVLRDAEGEAVGRVSFSDRGADMLITVRVELPERLAGFHGFHLHGNDDRSNGSGCRADADAPPETWFVSADGHYADEGQEHADHHGDFPSLLVEDDGSAYLAFTTDRLDLRDLYTRAVMIHAERDNYNNVPVGSEDDEYTPNSADATEVTAETGNAGDRFACGLVRLAD